MVEQTTEPKPQEPTESDESNVPSWLAKLNKSEESTAEPGEESEQPEQPLVEMASEGQGSSEELGSEETWPDLEAALKELENKGKEPEIPVVPINPRLSFENQVAEALMKSDSASLRLDGAGFKRILENVVRSSAVSETGVHIESINGSDPIIEPTGISSKVDTTIFWRSFPFGKPQADIQIKLPIDFNPGGYLELGKGFLVESSSKRKTTNNVVDGLRQKLPEINSLIVAEIQGKLAQKGLRVNISSIDFVEGQIAVNLEKEKPQPQETTSR